MSQMALQERTIGKRYDLKEKQKVPKTLDSSRERNTVNRSEQKSGNEERNMSQMKSTLS